MFKPTPLDPFSENLSAYDDVGNSILRLIGIIDTYCYDIDPTICRETKYLLSNAAVKWSKAKESMNVA